MKEFWLIYNVNTNSFMMNNGVTANGIKDATMYKTLRECEIVVSNWRERNSDLNNWTFRAIQFASIQHLTI